MRLITAQEWVLAFECSTALSEAGFKFVDLYLNTRFNEIISVTAFPIELCQSNM